MGLDLFEWLDEEYLIEAKDDWIKLENHLASYQEIGSKAIELFKKFKSRLKAEERDLYYWLKKDPEDFIYRMNELEAAPTRSQKSADAKSGADFITENEGWKVYKINTHEAARLYGKGTKWCITMSESHYWDNYTKDGDRFYFMIRKSPLQDEFDKIAIQVTIDREIKFWSSVDHNYNSLNTNLGIPLNVDGLDLSKYVKNYDIYTTYVLSDDGEVVTNSDGTVVETTHIDDYLKVSPIKKLIYTGYSDKYNYYHVNPFKWDPLGDAIETKIREVVVKEGVEEVQCEFGSQPDIEKIVLPSTLKHINQWSFAECHKITEITIPASVETIEQGAFQWCSKLQKVIFEQGSQLREIDKDTFSDCDLRELKLPDGIVNIYAGAFANNHNLIKVQVPKSIEYIGLTAFQGCDSLKETGITVPKGYEAFKQDIMSSLK